MKGTNETEISKLKRTSANETHGRLFFLEASVGRILSVNADGSDRKVILSGCRIPDGVVVHLEAGHIYWTNMGVPNRNDGSIERADLDGRTARQSFRKGARSRRSSSISRRRAGNFIGAIVRECA